MDPTNLLVRLYKRQLGYNGFRRNIFDFYVERLECEFDNLTINQEHNIGNTFACKFSRNRNNLHILACTTEHGEIIIQNTIKNLSEKQLIKSTLHDNAIFNFAWAEPDMKLITACGDQTTKLCQLTPSGQLIQEREFNYNSSVKSVMFCPGSKNVFCGGCQDGFIKIWDTRTNNNNRVLDCDHQIPNTHTIPGPTMKKKKTRKTVGVSCTIFKSDQTVISCSSMDPNIKVWDIRRSYRQNKGSIEPKPLFSYCHKNKNALANSGYVDMITNSLYTHLYASGVDNVIYCYPLNDATNTDLISQYSGHKNETAYSKISISNDGRYLFSGCIEQKGVIWLTDFPYEENPMFNIGLINDSLDTNIEFSNSDWCADSGCLKFAASADSVPLIWSASRSQLKKSSLRFMKTQAHKTKKLTSNILKTHIHLLDSDKSQTVFDQRNFLIS
ncbi:denticleless protein homolog B isoform X2 [Daktulosphaira vitifoliae]|uniref:denticleless protein homolog B isoform X2 n=1 Tax=Daktulosphaira vitifoliae TaxID=58002 RepID=UPI0021A97DE5|nr:denticleless protein homolog B isoform X2 [Daktulosphaira vitifoliae]